MAARTVPVGEELWRERDSHVEVLSNTLEDVTGHPKLIADGDTLDGADLVFPLAGHNLSVGAGDLDASVEAGSVVSVSDDSTEAVVGTYTAVVGALRARVAIVGPAERPGGELSLGANESVLLLDTVPRLLCSFSVKDFLGVNSEVCVCRLELCAGGVLPLVGLGHDEEVVSLSKGVTVHGHGLHDDLRVVRGGLVAGGAIVVPLGEVGDGVDGVIERSALGAEDDAAAVNPDVLGDDGVGHFGPCRGVVDVLVVQGEVGAVSH